MWVRDTYRYVNGELREDCSCRCETYRQCPDDYFRVELEINRPGVVAYPKIYERAFLWVLTHIIFNKKATFPIIPIPIQYQYSFPILIFYLKGELLI